MLMSSMFYNETRLIRFVFYAHDALGIISLFMDFIFVQEETKETCMYRSIRKFDLFMKQKAISVIILKLNSVQV